MDWLQSAMRKEGLEPQTSANSKLRSKLLVQADRMLKVIDSYKTEQELDGNGSKYWWAQQSVEGQRRIVMRAGSKAVDGSSVYADNTLPAVKEAIEKMRAVIESSTDEQWAEEEEKRSKK
jgi:hypothetical protein